MKNEFDGKDYYDQMEDDAVQVLSEVEKEIEKEQDGE